MQRPDDNLENARMADNLRRAIELTELALALRQSVLRQSDSDSDAMAEVMRDIRRAKELAWRQGPS
jgi:sugar phosphate isomerase/epimerase